MSENNTKALSILNTEGRDFYSSFVPKTMAERKKLFNLNEQCDVKLNDIKGQVVTVKDVIISAYPREDKETGEPLSDGHRTILVDAEGKSYITVSNYFFYAIVKLFQTFGTPDTWEEPLKLEICGKPLGNGKESLSFKIAD